jgi:methionyl aminopeptidase
MDKIIIKNQKQITGIRKSCQLAAATLRHVKQFVVPGISTEKLDRIIEDFIRSKGAVPATLEYRGFHPGQPNYPKSSCISVNEEVCHSIPDNYIIKEGDIVSIDVTTILNGYYGDTCITVPVGEISENAKHLMKVTEKCLDIGIRQVAPGVRTGVIGHAIHQYAILQNCTIVSDYCGHGVGIAFHEPPQIFHIAKKDDGVIMMEGQIFTVEPMINLGGSNVIIDETDKWTVRTADKSLSAQFEHTILVLSSGFEILTL